MKINMENWSVAYSGDEYTAPEARIPILRGDVVGHPNLGDAKGITTTRIIGKRGENIVVKSGKEYILGIVDAEYEKLYPNAKERLLKSLPEIPEEKITPVAPEITPEAPPKAPEAPKA